MPGLLTVPLEKVQNSIDLLADSHHVVYGAESCLVYTTLSKLLVGSPESLQLVSPPVTEAQTASGRPATFRPAAVLVLVPHTW